MTILPVRHYRPMKTTLKGEVSVKTEGYIHTGSDFSRHPEGLSFSGLSFRDTQRV